MLTAAVTQLLLITDEACMACYTCYSMPSGIKFGLQICCMRHRPT